jgi:hypothetical protein
VSLLLHYHARVSKHSANNQCFRYRTLITFETGEGGRDELVLPRRKERLTIKSPEDEFEASDVQTRQWHDPQELKIYIKQLSKALKFLPLGSRAYYAVTGELLRASTQLKALVPTGTAMKGEH